LDKNQCGFLPVNDIGDFRHRAERFRNHWKESALGANCHDSVFRVAYLSDFWVQEGQKADTWGSMKSSFRILLIHFERVQGFKGSSERVKYYLTTEPIFYNHKIF